ncbi:MAG: diguanylate cyclase [Gammaproteobacteria bacterium]|nr:diguanylate cyclase [Gammaproteobacteria bacterium]
MNSSIPFKAIVEEANDIVIITKADPLDAPGPEIVYVNKAFTRLTGYTPEEAIGKNPRMLQTQSTDQDTTADIRRALDKEESIRVSIQNKSKTGDEYWLDMCIRPLTDENGKVTHFVAIERDITEQKELEHKLEELSKKDPMTGLNNRRAFDISIAEEFQRFQRSQSIFSILMIDIDNFKQINDQYGHAAGDEALEKMSDIFDLLFRNYDRPARMGGDEFCIILPDTSLDNAILTAERLRQMVAVASFSVSNENIKATVSVGVTCVDLNDVDYDDVVKRADQALYTAKENGRNQVASKQA